MRIYKTRADFTKLQAVQNPSIFAGTICTITDEALNPMYVFQGGVWNSTVTATTNPLTGGSIFLDGDNKRSGMLHPSGNDDAARIEQYVADMAASGLVAELGPGDFVVGSPMAWRSAKKLGKWGDKGIGLHVKGKGVGNTRLLWSSASNTDAMLSLNSPTSSSIGNRNYMAKIEGMSIVRAPSGAEIAAGTTSGVGIFGVPTAAGEVLHTIKFKDLFMDGFDYPVTLSDCTLPEFDFVWFCEFLTAIRLGYNVDICRIRHSMFGSEQFGTSYRNNAIAIQNGFNDGINPASSENVVEISHTWFMNIGKALEAKTANLQGVKFNQAYFENVQQYFHHADNATGYSVVGFESCHFSHPTTNDTAQSNPTVAGYKAKIQFDGDVATGAGKNAQLVVRDCTADLSQPANAWVSFVHVDSHVTWANNAMLYPSATYGHIRCVRTAKAAQRTFPQSSSLYGGTWVLGDKVGSGLAVTFGDPIEVTATVSGTYSVNVLAGSHFYLTLPDADCTIQIDAPSSGYYADGQSNAKVILIAPASVTATRTITFGSRLTGAGATLSMLAGDVNKRAIMLLEGTGKGDVSMRCVSQAPSFV